MKKLLKLTLLVGLFISISSSEIFSQTITNNTDCVMRVIVFHDCSDNVTYDVPANDFITMLGGNALAASGAALQFTTAPCGFRVSDGDCAPLNLTDTANCSPQSICPTYTGTLDPTTGSITID